MATAQFKFRPPQLFYSFGDVVVVFLFQILSWVLAIKGQDEYEAEEEEDRKFHKH